MSLIGSWELKAPKGVATRSLCMYTALVNDQESSNPFEVAAGNDAPSAKALVFGTEKGSLHYRTYSTPSSSSSSSSSSTGSPQAPLGVAAAGAHRSSSSGSTASNVPRAYLPVNLAVSSLPGPVVDLWQAGPAHRPVFMVLVDDNRGNSGGGGQYLATMVTLQHGSFSKVTLPASIPRVSSATFHARSGFVVSAGRHIHTIPPDVVWPSKDSNGSSTTSTKKRPGRRAPLPPLDFSHATLPAPGARGGSQALTMTAQGQVAVVAVGTVVYAIAGRDRPDDQADTAAGGSRMTQTSSLEQQGGGATKVIGFAQSSQVHGVICLDLQDTSMDADWYSLLCANGREAAVVDLNYYEGVVSCSAPRNGVVTLASPILAAASSWPWCALLTSDGLVSIRSPSCLAVALKTVEVGTRPNDFFVLRTFPEEHAGTNASLSSSSQPMIAMSYSGQAKILQCHPDTSQDLADRLMRQAIDAFGAAGFPRSELAEAIHASFTATSYVGPEPTNASRELLRQYLEAILGLTDIEGGAASGWPTEWNTANSSTSSHLPSPFEEASRQQQHQNTSSTVEYSSNITSTSGKAHKHPPVISATHPDALLSATALLCLVCAPPPSRNTTTTVPSNSMTARKASLGNRAAKACATQMGVLQSSDPTVSPAATKVCERVADRLLLSGKMELVEAASWLLRSCGKHERAIDILWKRMQQPTTSSWPPIKYQSYTATHLSELWATNKEAACRLVLTSPATRHLLERNPHLGLNVFTVGHPQNEKEWKGMLAKDDPLAQGDNVAKVVKLLKDIQPKVLGSNLTDADVLPMESGRALAVTYLESAIGIDTGRPPDEDMYDALEPDSQTEERIADFHDELCYLLLEGVISERGDHPARQQEEDNALGTLYRHRLRRLLQWPLAKVHSERLLGALPKSFLQEQALVLGRMGRHEDALRILYVDCKSMELALEYCDMRYEQHQVKLERERAKSGRLRDDTRDHNPFGHHPPSNDRGEGCVYLPLVRVALESDLDKKRGTAAAIQVLALRRNSIDRAAALRLLPKNIPVSAVARPFLIPALVESESQARRLMVVSSLLRARHSALIEQLTDAQLKAQSSLQVVPQLKPLKLGDPLHSTKAVKARPSSSASATFPDVVIIKHFFPSHVVIQAKVTNNSGAVDGRALGNIAFVVAESSEEAVQPSTQVPVKVLPFKATGSTWCVLIASPNRMEGTAILACELRYTVMGVDAAGTPMSFGGTIGHTFVEELQDLEIYASHFS